MTARTAGRKGRPWRRLQDEILGVVRGSAVCWICHHYGAVELDHVDMRARGGSSYDPNNLRPAHGTNGRCPVCGRACNQERRRKAGPRGRVVALNTSRSW